VNAGRRRADKPTRPKGPGLVGYTALLGLGIVVAAAAWFFLVRAAVDFGQAARDGQSLAWAFCVGATLGATLCLLLVFVLGARVWVRFHAAKVERSSRPARLPGGRHHR
jgi:hypothetical protein